MLSSLRDSLKEIIRAQAPAIQADLAKILERPGYALSHDGPCRAGILALEVHRAIEQEDPGPSALLAAAAVELQMEAAYVFDHVADDGPFETRSEELALAIALLTAGGKAAAEAAARCADPSGALTHFHRSYAEASAGQYLDAMLQRRGSASFEEALKTTCLKAGGLGEFAAGFAARVAGAGDKEIALFDGFGFNVFVFAQLVDDLRDACTEDAFCDLAQRKATLPVVFYGRSAGTDDMLDVDRRQHYESSGAPLYVAILAQAHLTRAEELLSKLAQGGYGVIGLGSLLRDVGSAAEGDLGAALVGVVP